MESQKAEPRTSEYGVAVVSVSAAWPTDERRPENNLLTYTCHLALFSHRILALGPKGCGQFHQQDDAVLSGGLVCSTGRWEL